MEETPARKTSPETSTSRIPIPKLQKQLQIHLYRLPEFMLQCPLSQTQCWHQLKPQTFQSETHSTIPHSSSQSPVSPSAFISMTDSKKKTPISHFHNLPLNDLPLGKCLSHHPSKLSAPFTDLLSACRSRDTTLQLPSQTLDPDTELQEDIRDKQKDPQEDQPEETVDIAVKEMKKSPTIDPKYVLRSQNPSECASVNALAGVTNGLSYKAMMKNRYKIRVDFKVGIFFIFFFVPQFNNITRIQLCFSLSLQFHCQSMYVIVKQLVLRKPNHCFFVSDRRTVLSRMYG